MIDKENAKKIVKFIGGQENVINLTHCATRLRFKLKDTKIADTAKIESLSDVLKVMEGSGQYQVVIGTEVADMYSEVNKIIDNSNSYNSDKSTDNEADKKTLKDIINSIFDVISSSFTPLLPVLAGAGVLKAIMLLLSGLNIVSDTSTTMQILTGMQNSFFYFLPIILSVSMAKKLNVNPYIAATIGASLLEPNIIALVGVKNVSFFGLPMTIQNYSNTVFPVLIAIPLYSVVFKWLNKVVPKLINVLIVPVLCISIVVPIVLFILGPFGVYFGKAIADFVTLLFSSVPLLAGAFLGGLWTILVLFGLHWAIIPIAIASIATTGSDQIIACAGAATYSAIGVVFGILLKSKDKDLKSLMVSGLIPLLFAGISEPVLYGATLRYKKLLYFSIISGAIGGAITAVTGMKITILFFSILTLQTGINWIGGLVAGIVTIIITVGLILMFGYKDKGKVEV